MGSPLPVTFPISLLVVDMGFVRNSFDMGSTFPWQEMTFPQWWEHFCLALQMMTWDGRRWATQPEQCCDFLEAWWLAGHAIEMRAELMAFYYTSGGEVL